MSKVLTFVVICHFAEPPDFAQKLPSTKFVKLSDAVVLECKVTGTAPLQINWFKNDSKLTEGHNCKITFDGSVAILHISSTSFDDSGVYTCEAQNDAGTKSCSTTLTVKGQILYKRN